MSNLEASVPANSSDPTVAERREQTMEKWMRYIFKHGDQDRDGQIDLEEAKHLSKRQDEKRGEGHDEEDEWKSLEEEDESEEEYEYAEYN